MFKVMQKTNKYFMLAGLSFLAAASIGGMAHAETTTYNKETKARADVDQVLNVSIPSSVIELPLDPSTSPFAAEDFYIYVSTNNATGYYMTVSSESSTLYNMSDANETIPTISSSSPFSYWDASNFEVNRWAYSLNRNDYQPFTSGVTIASSDTTVNTDSTLLIFAANVDFYQPAGIYKTELEFLTVANPTIMAIQDLDEAYCTEDPLVVMDARDGEEYTIQRLADGNCWMLDNLRLDPSETPIGALKNRTNANSQSIISLKNGGGTSPLSTGAFEPTTQYFTEAYTTPAAITSNKDRVIDGTPGAGSGKAGVFYNFCAASAGSYCYDSNADTSGIAIATSDICPAGWRMPTGGDNGEYKALLDAVSTSESEPENAIKFRTALSIPLAGRGDDYQEGDYGYLWTSTNAGAHEMIITQVGSDSALFTEDKERSTARPLRCIMNRDLTTLTYMQEITPNIVIHTEIGTTAILKDRRDNEEYRVTKLKDGNIWLLENLRLDPTAVPLETLQGDTDASNESLTYLKNGGGTSPYAVNPVSSDFGGDFYYTYYTPQIYTGRKNEEVSKIDIGLGSGKIGIYYNYCAATAGSYCYEAYATESMVIEESICPTGWRLPRTGYSSDIADELNDMQKLSAAYAEPGNSSAPNNVLGEALNIITTGVINYYDSSLTNTNTGSFWSSVYSSSRYIKYAAMYYYGNYTYFTNNNATRSTGIPVRCVAKTE